MQFNDLENFKKWINAVEDEKIIYIVGAGQFGDIIGKYLNNNQIKWRGYIDKNRELVQVNGKSVYSYENIEEKNSFFIVSSISRQNLLLEELYKVNIQQESIITFSNRDILHEMLKDYINYEEYTKRIKIFENKYYGKRCFIVGNGPSLQISDLEMLKNEITFAANGIYLLYPHTTWRPTFYCTHDTAFGNREMATREKISQKISECEAGFTSMVLKAFQYRDDFSNLFFLKLLAEYEEENSIPLFSTDCSEIVYTSTTVTYTMLQLAVYMGFKEIYLLGVDCVYSSEKKKDGTIIKNDVKNHQKIIASEDEQYEQKVLETAGAWAQIDLMLDGYKAAQKYAEGHSIKIYNATRGGKLEVFKRIDFDGLFD